MNNEEKAKYLSDNDLPFTVEEFDSIKKDDKSISSPLERDWEKEFVKKFVNNHNLTWRPLRGLWHEEVLAFIHSEKEKSFAAGVANTVYKGFEGDKEGIHNNALKIAVESLPPGENPSDSSYAEEEAIAYGFNKALSQAKANINKLIKE